MIIINKTNLNRFCCHPNHLELEARNSSIFCQVFSSFMGILDKVSQVINKDKLQMFLEL